MIRVVIEYNKAPILKSKTYIMSVGEMVKFDMITEKNKNILVKEYEPLRGYVDLTTVSTAQDVLNDIAQWREK